MKIAIILGSSRVDGNTHSLVKLFMKHQPSDLFDLKDYSISAFDYHHQNKNDDFLGLIKVLRNYDKLIFATPVYWYSMSAQMKVFFDRISDLLTIEKSLGRALNGKFCSVLATGSDESVPECFVAPFQLSADYLGMKFISAFYCSCTSGFVDEEHNDNLLTHIGAGKF